MLENIVSLTQIFILFECLILRFSKMRTAAKFGFNRGLVNHSLSFST